MVVRIDPRYFRPTEVHTLLGDASFARKELGWIPEIKIRDLLRRNEGAVNELDRLAGDPLDILVNGTMSAKGEIVMVGERFGVRFTEIVEPEKRVENL